MSNVVPHGATNVDHVFQVMEIVDDPTTIFIDEIYACRGISIILVDSKGNGGALHRTEQVDIFNLKLIERGKRTGIACHRPMINLKEECSCLLFLVTDRHQQIVP